ncbi:hypothetical protein O181_058117 [Austropuccinia psidii MF-1]|uniref:Uncharacterized protein n=1 Tax=Austropuccinia psidii MF-1 TaxID=1389203 RepID=A0A9Q3EJ43_9BASI|nr:hypothetical protein [Austropuccinia psidii MF-1]
MSDMNLEKTHLQVEDDNRSINQDPSSLNLNNRKRVSIEPDPNLSSNDNNTISSAENASEKRQKIDPRPHSQFSISVDPPNPDLIHQSNELADSNLLNPSPQPETPASSNQRFNSHQNLPQSQNSIDQDQAAKDLNKKPQPTVDQRKRHEDQSRQYLLAQTQPIIIPSYAAWFDLSTIHAIEKKSLPEFFNGRNRSKVPSIYKDYRDFIVNSYRLNPSEYLTVTACRRNLAGDVCAIMRVHAFLEQWGIINYQVDADTRPAAVGPPFTGHFRVLLDTPRNLIPLHPGTISRKTPASLSSASVIPPQSLPTHSSGPSNIDLRKNIYPTPSDKTGQITTRCDVCGTDCSRLSYHHTRLRNYDICSNCFQEGRFGNQMNSAEFVKLERSNKSPIDSNWTDQELLLLLEGLEMYSDDWEKIADHVGGTKTKEECILQFLQMPIEDEFLRDPTINPNSGINTLFGLGKIPLSGAENPVLSVLSFLIGLVDPTVVAEMTGKSMDKIKSDLKSKVSALQEDGLRQGTSSQNLNETVDSSNSDVKIDAGALKPNPVIDSSSNSMDIDQVPSEQQSSKKSASDIAAAALAAASAKSLILGSADEIELGKLLESITDQTIKKLELKLKQFQQFESLIEIERRNLEQWRETLTIERQVLVKEVVEIKKLKGNENDNNPKIELNEVDRKSMIGQPVQVIPIKMTNEQCAADELNEPEFGTMNIG